MGVRESDTECQGIGRGNGGDREVKWKCQALPDTEIMTLIISVSCIATAGLGHDTSTSDELLTHIKSEWVKALKGGLEIGISQNSRNYKF